MQTEDVLLKFINEFGLTKGSLLTIFLLLANLLKGLKFRHFKETFKLIIDKQKKELKDENTNLSLQLALISNNYNTIVRLTKRSNAIYKILNVFRDKYNLAYVNIFEYHNGVTNLASDCLMRYTMTYTVYHPFGFDLKHEHDSQSLNRYSDIISLMIENGVFDTDIKDFQASKNHRDKLNVEREIAYFLKNDKGEEFGAISVLLPEGYNKGIEYKKELEFIKKEIEEVYNTYRNENTTKLD